MELNGRSKAPTSWSSNCAKTTSTPATCASSATRRQSLMQDRARVVLDMAGVKFVDSSGLGALISCLRQVNGRKGDFRLC